MTPPRPARQRPGATSPLGGQTQLRPEVEPLKVGEGTAVPAPAAEPEPVPKRRRVAFGTYLPPELQRAFKARCVLLGVEMQDATEEAIRRWLEEHPAPDQPAS